MAVSPYREYMRSKAKDDDRFTVIVILGAAVWPGGKPSPTLKRRTLHASSLYKRKRGKKIIASGGLGENPPTEAVVMKQILLADGVEEKDIILDEKSLTTFDSAVNVRKILRQNHYSDVILVTSSYHVVRSLLAFRSLGIKAKASASPEKKGETDYNNLAWLHVREILALPWYVALALFHRIARMKSN